MNTKSNDWTGDLLKLLWLTTFFAVSSRKAKDAAQVRDRLAAESTEMEWTEDEVRWDTAARIWDELANRIGDLLTPLLEGLGLTVEEVVDPFLRTIYARQGAAA